MFNIEEMMTETTTIRMQFSRMRTARSLTILWGVGRAWQGEIHGGGVHGREDLRGRGGHAWQGVCMVGDMCVSGGMHGRGHLAANFVCGR